MIEVIGIGAGGTASLGPDERRLVERAEVVLGGERHLAMLDDAAGRELIPWPSPLRSHLPRLLQRVSGRRAVVLASGDPMVSGIASTMIELLGPEAVRVHPHVSSVALARARMRWSSEDCETVTLVGRDHDRLRRHLAPRARLVVLTHGADAPTRLAELLVEEGYGESILTVLGDLGGVDESRHDAAAARWDGPPAPRLHLVCIECRLDGTRTARSLVPGLPDDVYDSDGQLTRRILRAAALAHLAPTPGDVMWDLGAGAGSIGIEFARQDPRNRVYAAERVAARAARARSNARALGVPGLVVLEAPSVDAIKEFPSPDAVFVGGGATEELLERVWERLTPGGRLVVHAVTLETEALLHAMHRRRGGSLTRLAVEDAQPLGRSTGWAPRRAVIQWAAAKPAARQGHRKEPS
ncbi:precorrin-6Y C5,15-methyltransferase [Intrasporangium chromatireducens Q5-1]|uniref:Precorrin-6Y C5,15-methyltransferase n=1 Tax=Intrasporangium chromatireducens Q5-1 TaxID=584657 RepID=W9GLD0_9MICO|nr:precorrin-6Y C5,15-methyltransferase [Intrasporangium chromatireducens Q5-1]